MESGDTFSYSVGVVSSSLYYYHTPNRQLIITLPEGTDNYNDWTLNSPHWLLGSSWSWGRVVHLFVPLALVPSQWSPNADLYWETWFRGVLALYIHGPLCACKDLWLCDSTLYGLPEQGYARDVVCIKFCACWVVALHNMFLCAC